MEYASLVILYTSRVKFTVEKKGRNSTARAGEIETPHGIIETPAFVPVATQAALKGVRSEAAETIGVSVIFANTFHLHLSPGEAVIKSAGGLHKFMNWLGPIMTDSGGFQVFSLGAAYGQGVSKVARASLASMGQDAGLPLGSLASKLQVSSLVKINDDGVDFQSPRDGSSHRLTPESSITIQHDLGADIILAFDECTTPQASYSYQCEALERTHRWAERSLEQHQKLLRRISRPPLKGAQGEALELNSPALFGIVQGGRAPELRESSAKFIGGLNFDGFAIGGSFNKEDIGAVVALVNRQLLPDRPRHLLGIGEVEDIFVGVENGVDTLDCVTPTRLGRHGTVETKHGRLNLSSGKFAADSKPIEDDCDCEVCRHYSRAYLSHLFRAREMLATTLTSIHNLHFFISLMGKIRVAILDDNFDSFRHQFLTRYLST